MILTKTKGASKVYILIVITTCLVCLTGLFTDLKLHDEVHHYWFALQWFEKGSRPVGGGQLMDNSYQNTAPLWHFGLSRLMWVFGPSMALAQMYQAFFFGLLGIGTYLLARELYGEEQGLWALILVLSTPMFLAFSVLLMVDVPLASLAPLLLLCLKRGKVFLSGVVLGTMFLMKMHSYLLLPAIVILTLTRPEYGIKKRIKDLSIILAIAIFMIIPDRDFHLKTYNGVIFPKDEMSLTKMSISLNERNRYTMATSPYSDNINFPVNVPKHLGVFLPVFFFFTITKYYRQLSRNDLWVLLPVCLYMPLYLYFFWQQLPARYLAPVIPFFVIYASRGIAGLGEREVLRPLLILLCIAQTVTVLGYVYEKRRITPMEKEALKAVTSEVSQEERILTRERFISYYTGRPTVWWSCMKRGHVTRLFWGRDVESAVEVLHAEKISYVLVQKTQIYDDSKVRHIFDYPTSFIKKLPLLAEKIWENDSMVLWQVNKAQGMSKM